jgi:hypothetical protein
MVTRSIRPARAHVGVGDQVRFKFGLSSATGRIVATRGPVRRPGEIKYLVEFRRGGSDPLERDDLSPSRRGIPKGLVI